MNEKQVAISIRPTEELYTWLRDEAEKNFRSINQHVLYLLDKARKESQEQQDE